MKSRQPLASNREDQVPNPARRTGDGPEGKDEGEFVKLFLQALFLFQALLMRRKENFYG